MDLQVLQGKRQEFGQDHVYNYTCALLFQGLKYLTYTDAVRDNHEAMILNWRIDVPQFWKKKHSTSISSSASCKQAFMTKNPNFVNKQTSLSLRRRCCHKWYARSNCNNNRGPKADQSPLVTFDSDQRALL